MIKLSNEDKIEINRIIKSIQGRLDEKLIKLIMNLIFKTRIKIKKEDFQLYSSNVDEIPDKSLISFSVGSSFGQIFQISLDLAKKMNLNLDNRQKRILREFVFFLVLFKFGKEVVQK
ncbi:MAG: hypothetical protein OEL77_00170 [Nitrosopumilus sp.]|nr:hypothetical protein [Nitrosopumilus sp.]